MAKTYSRNKSSVYEIVKKEEEICATFALTPQIAKVVATMCDKYLSKMKKVLNLYSKIVWERETAFT